MSLSAHNVKVQIMYKIDKWILHKKSQKPNIIAVRPTRIKFNCQRISSKNTQFVHHQFFKGPRRLQQCHRELKGPVMPSETSLTKRPLLHLHQAANSTSLEPSDYFTSSQAKCYPNINLRGGVI